MNKNIFFIFVMALILVAAIGYQYQGTNRGDFLGYWSSAYLFIHGGNPYNQSEMISLQKSITNSAIDQPEELINAWNPPWLMEIISPLALLPFQTALNIWTFINAFLIGLTLVLSWQLASTNQTSKGILAAFVGGYLFGITISYLVIGQITILVILGILLTIWFLNKSQDRLAGGVFVLAMIKPHITYLFLLVFLVWVIKNKRWKVIQGILIVLMISMAIFWIIDPTWVSDYVNLLRKLPNMTVYTSTIGSFFAAKFNSKLVYFLSIFLLLLIKPLLRIQEKNGWLTALNLSLLVSIPLSPFGFVFDQIVLLPSIIQIIYWICNAGIPKRFNAMLIGLLAILDLLVIYLLSIDGLEYYWFFFIPIILLVIYMIAWKMSNRFVTTDYSPINIPIS